VEEKPDAASSVFSIRSSDLRKLLGIRWFCFYPEHQKYGIVLVNTLLQQLLLAAESDLLLGFSLRTAGEKLSACKILLTQFFPIDSRQVAQEYIAMFFASNNESEDTLERLEHAGNAAFAEHSALISYLEAHTAYEEWRKVIAVCEQSQPTPPWSNERIAAAGWNAAEKEIAAQQEYRLYRHKMAALARTALQMTETAQRTLLHVLEFPGGWLDLSSTKMNLYNSPEEWEVDKRETEIRSVQKLYLPHALFMLHSVWDGAASWASKFSAGVDVARERELFHEFETSYFEPEYWHRKALALSEMVASEESLLQETLTREELEHFLKLMAESAVNLVRLIQ